MGRWRFDAPHAVVPSTGVRWQESTSSASRTLVAKASSQQKRERWADQSLNGDGEASFEPIQPCLQTPWLRVGAMTGYQRTRRFRFAACRRSSKSPLRSLPRGAFRPRHGPCRARRGGRRHGSPSRFELATLNTLPRLDLHGHIARQKCSSVRFTINLVDKYDTRGTELYALGVELAGKQGFAKVSRQTERSDLMAGTGWVAVLARLPVVLAAALLAVPLALPLAPRLAGGSAERQRSAMARGAKTILSRIQTTHTTNTAERVGSRPRTTRRRATGSPAPTTVRTSTTRSAASTRTATTRASTTHRPTRTGNDSLRSGSSIRTSSRARLRASRSFRCRQGSTRPRSRAQQAASAREAVRSWRSSRPTVPAALGQQAAIGQGAPRSVRRRRQPRVARTGRCSDRCAGRVHNRRKRKAQAQLSRNNSATRRASGTGSRPTRFSRASGIRTWASSRKSVGKVALATGQQQAPGTATRGIRECALALGTVGAGAAACFGSSGK